MMSAVDDTVMDQDALVVCSWSHDVQLANDLRKACLYSGTDAIVRVAGVTCFIRGQRESNVLPLCVCGMDRGKTERTFADFRIWTLEHYVVGGLQAVAPSMYQEE